MGKLLLFALVVAVLWWIIRGSGKPAAGSGSSQSVVEDMVRCAHCGVHLPRSESYASNNEFFCSEEHLRLHR